MEEEEEGATAGNGIFDLVSEHLSVTDDEETEINWSMEVNHSLETLR